ncbi:hypothetical protein ACS0TY_032696 [Phlomoides rotata]
MEKSIADFGRRGLWSIWRDSRREVGAQLNVPRGKWLTGSFNLTSNFTLFLDDGAFVLGSQVTNLIFFNYLL